MNTVKTKLFMSQVLRTIQVNLGPFRLGILDSYYGNSPLLLLCWEDKTTLAPVPLRKRPCASFRLRGACPRMWLPQSHSPLSIHTLLYLL